MNVVCTHGIAVPLHTGLYKIGGHSAAHKQPINRQPATQAADGTSMPAHEHAWPPCVALWKIGREAAGGSTVPCSCKEQKNMSTWCVHPHRLCVWQM